MLNPKVAIIGAGNVGIRYAYSLMISGLSRSIVINEKEIGYLKKSARIIGETIRGSGL